MILPPHLVIFFISSLCISLELFFARILNLKTWNHVVYVVIPFAILGYGIGANIVLILQERIRRLKEESVVAASLLLLAAVCLLSTLALIRLPVQLADLTGYFVSLPASLTLLLAYAILAAPFVVMGFLVVYLFSENPRVSHRLYGWDLLGAGGGAVAFFPLISRVGVSRSLGLLAACTLCLGLAFLRRTRKWPAVALFAACSLALLVPEITSYTIDRTKGWEFIPGFFEPRQYERVISRWSPLGRTDAYRIKDAAAQNDLADNHQGTFEIDLVPAPEFSYFCTNFIAGTPVYKLSPEGLREAGSRVQLFSQAMEFPYLLLKEPRVVVLGAGGGRDIFMAKTHGATEVVGAEVNPVTHAAMSHGGVFHDYSGGVYTLAGVQVRNMDGRHLVKRLAPGSFDLLVLNGVDSFSGLASGAFVYAESYLYTKNALLDYLRILDQDGMINFNRWFFPHRPRETLRLFAIALDALRTWGVQKPWEHIVVGHHRGWGMMLIKKTPFTPQEVSLLAGYFNEHDTDVVYPREDPRAFDLYAKAFREGNEAAFVRAYPFDISVVSDDSPFFFKYYRLKDFNPFRVETTHYPVHGTVVFASQAVTLLSALAFIVGFILLPLVLLKREGMRGATRGRRFPCVLFFGCLGLGFMFIEIPLMQRFGLLLGSPLHAISITLAALLIFSGLGSLALPRLKRVGKSEASFLAAASLMLTAFILLLVGFGTQLLDLCMAWSFWGRSLAVCFILLPLGLCLGLFFPSGLKRIGSAQPAAVAWAWGINCGFTVLGSLFAIVLAQLRGFNFVLLLAALCYLTASLAFKRLG